MGHPDGASALICSTRVWEDNNVDSRAASDLRECNGEVQRKVRHGAVLGVWDVWT